MPHGILHVSAGLALLALVAGLRAIAINRIVRRKLLVSLVASVAFVALHVPLPDRLSGEFLDVLRALEASLFVLAAVNTLVTLLANPLRVDRVPERFPSIVQDAVTLAMFLAIATLILGERFQVTSVVGAAVLGFALQDTLGNLFAGLAIQSEKPFRIGHWIAVAGLEGKVTEITWRATKLRTKAGNFVVVPNSTIGRESITNYSEPIVPTRLQFDVGVTYLAPPNDVKQAIREVMAAEPLVLTDPAPEVLITDFGSSAVVYRLRFWIEDYALDTQVADRLRSGIYYMFQRRRIEIPYPIQVEYRRDWTAGRSPEQTAERRGLLRAVDLFAPLSESELAGLLEQTTERLYGDGETVVREGDPGASMFIVCTGRLRVTAGPSSVEVATIEAGGYVGEMSLLTGDPRSATVIARGDCAVLEITADIFRRIVRANPAVLERISAIVEVRRAQLAGRVAAAPAVGVSVGPKTSRPLLDRIRRFFGLVADGT